MKKSSTGTPQHDPRPKPGTKRLYLDKEAEGILNACSAKWDMHRSNIVAGLLRAMAGLPPKRGEEPVAAQLKETFESEFRATFLKAVENVIGEAAQPARQPGNGTVPQAGTWILGKTGIVAFSKLSANAGQLFSEASQAKHAHKLTKVAVVHLFSDIIPKLVRDDLSKIGIEVISLGGLRKFLADNGKTPKG